jgi:hypothetical protein
MAEFSAENLRYIGSHFLFARFEDRMFSLGLKFLGDEASIAK